MKNSYIIPIIILIIFAIFLIIGFSMFDIIKANYFSSAGTVWLSKTVYDNPNTVNVYLVDFFPKNPSYPSYLDGNVTGISGTSLSSIRAKVKSMSLTVANTLSDGSAYRKYPNAPYKYLNAKNYLSYNLVDRSEFLEPIPLREELVPGSSFEHFPDYKNILGTKLNVCDLVDKQGIDEIWINSYHYKQSVPIESNMAMGRVVSNYFNHGSYGDISNSYQDNDLPLCERTYTVYTYNYGRSANEMVHNHIHQFEVLMDKSMNIYAAQTYKGSFSYQDFVGQFPEKGGTNSICGNAHFPINTQGEEYKYNINRTVSNYCSNMTWKNSGAMKTVNCSHWGCNELGWYKYWLNSIPGYGNQMQSGSLRMRNFWDMISSFDNFIFNQVGKCEFSMVYDLNKPVPANCQSLPPIKPLITQTSTSTISSTNTTNSNITKSFSAKVNVYTLYVRSNAGTSNGIVGYIYRGNVRPVLCAKNIGGTYPWWGKIEEGRYIYLGFTSVTDNSGNAVTDFSTIPTCP